VFDKDRVTRAVNTIAAAGTLRGVFPFLGLRFVGRTGAVRGTLKVLNPMAVVNGKYLNNLLRI